MFCGNCGKEIKENDVFCGNCGAKVSKTTNSNENERSKSNNKKKVIKITLTRLILIVMTILLLFCISAGIIISSNKKQTPLSKDEIEKIESQTNTYNDSETDTSKSILDNLDDELHINHDDYVLDTFDNQSYYMYVYLTDEKLAKADFIYELQLIGGIYKDDIKQDNEKVTLYVKTNVYDKVYNVIKNINGVKYIEKTTTPFKQEDLGVANNSQKYLMQIWSKIADFEPANFYVFCTNYRRNH